MLIYKLFSSSLVGTWGVVGLWWCKTRAICALHWYRTRWRLLWTCGSCFYYRIYILLIISYIHFPWCPTCYSASNGWYNPRFGVQTEELCPSHVIEVNINYITIIQVLPRNWFRTTRLLHFNYSMLIYTMFSSSLVRTWGVVRLWWYKLELFVRYVDTGPDRGFSGLMGHVFIIYYIYFL
jgi:hypothetical protein